MSTKVKHKTFTYGSKPISKKNTDIWEDIKEEKSENLKTYGKPRGSKKDIWAKSNVSPFKMKQTKQYEDGKKVCVKSADDPFGFDDADDGNESTDPFTFENYAKKTPTKVKKSLNKSTLNTSKLTGKMLTPTKTINVRDLKSPIKPRNKTRENNIKSKNAKCTEKKSIDESEIFKVKKNENNNIKKTRTYVKKVKGFSKCKEESNNNCKKEKDNTNKKNTRKNNVVKENNKEETDKCDQTEIKNNVINQDKFTEVIDTKNKDNSGDETILNNNTNIKKVKEGSVQSNLFSYYGKKTGQNLEKNKLIYAGSKRPRISEDSDSDSEVVSDKNSQQFSSQTSSQSTSCGSSSQDSGITENSECSSQKRLRSPFKSLKQKSQAKKFRRFSALPTSLDNDEVECTQMENKEESTEVIEEVPKRLYQTFLFPSQSIVNTAVRVKRNEKELFQVVKNTKQAYQCLEYGETQKYKDDLEFLLEGLQKCHKLMTRCLSAIELAKKCLSPNFRMHIKAHGIVEAIFDVLQDALENESLAFCTSAVLFVLANDKLMVDFDDKIIGLILKLITKKYEEVKTKEFEKLIQKIKNLFEKEEYSNIALDELDATTLARETLLSLTSRQTGQWFKKEIRVQCGLDHIIDTIYGCSRNIINGDNSLLKNLSKMKRCLVLLVDVSSSDLVNQEYIISYRDGLMVEISTKVISSEIPIDEKDNLIEFEGCLLSILQLLLNLTHQNHDGVMKICKQENSLSAILKCILCLPKTLKMKRHFDFITMSLAVLINIAEHNKDAIAIIVSADVTAVIATPLASNERRMSGNEPPCLKALVDLFLVRHEAGKEGNLMEELDRIEKEEAKLSESMHFHDDGEALTYGDHFDDTTVVEDNESTIPQNEAATLNIEPRITLNEEEKKDINYVLTKAHENMMDSHVAAYTALLLGLLVEQNQENQDTVRSNIPDKSFTALSQSLERILGFVKTTGAIDENGCKIISRIITFYQSLHNA